MTSNNDTYIIGYTLAKNINKYQYPAELNIRQHGNLIDDWDFIVPLRDQDLDDTADTLYALNIQNGTGSVGLWECDWPNKEGFGTESIDKILQTNYLNKLPIPDGHKPSIWLFKHDIDEFIHESHFEFLRELLYDIRDTDITTISFGYRQLVGSYGFAVKDPTYRVNHLFKLQRDKDNNIIFNYPGNDAMNVFTPGTNLHLPEITTFHTGYVKSKELLTIKVKEHFLLNKSKYADIESKINSFEWEWPTHKYGANLWPLGIGHLRGQKNEIEFFEQNKEELPLVLRERINKDVFYTPDLYSK